MDTLRPLPKKKNNNTHAFITTDRYRKRTRAILMRNTTAGLVATTFINNWILPNMIPDSILTHNGTQSVTKLFKNICHVMGLKRRTTTSYHPRQMDRHNVTTTHSPRDFVTTFQNTKMIGTASVNHLSIGITSNRMEKQARFHSMFQLHARHHHQLWTKYRQITARHNYQMRA